MAVADGTSCNSLPYSSSGRLEVMIVERSSWRRMMTSKRCSPAFFGSCFMPMSSIDEEIGLQVTLERVLVTRKSWLFEHQKRLVRTANPAVSNTDPGTLEHAGEIPRPPAR